MPPSHVVSPSPLQRSSSKIRLFIFLLLASNATSLPKSCSWATTPIIDIREPTGVQINKLAGSRVEYYPFPIGYRLQHGHTLQVEFKTTSSSGIIFLAGDFDRADIASAYLRRGHLAFARRCGSGRAFEIHHSRLDDGKWHSLIFNHSENGGRLTVDGKSSFRNYHLGPCLTFSAVVFGGLSTKIQGATKLHHQDGESEYRETELAAQHRLSGCLRNLKFDGKWPLISPKYHAISQCDSA